MDDENMKRLALVLLPLALVSCGPNRDQRHAAFQKRCQAAEFSGKQCDLLFEMAEQEAEDASSATTSATLAVTMGVIGVAGAGAK